MSVITLENVHKTYPLGKQRVEAVKGVSFSVEKGEFAAISGPSGSGKSTLLYTVSGMDSMTAGEVLFCGKELSKMSDKELSAIRLGEMGFVFQQMYMLKNLTVLDNIILPAMQAKSKDTKRKEIVEHGLSLMRKLDIVNLPSLPLK